MNVNMLDPTRITADVALTLALPALALRLAPRGEWSMLAWRFWTAAAGAYLLHVAAAFHFVHHWSHAEAFEHAVKRTYEVVGVATGIGIWINYGFTLVWLADVVLWGVDLRLAQRADVGRPRWLAMLRAPAIRLAWVAFFLFMAFNATMVFEGGVTRAYFGVLFTVAAIYVVVRRIKHV